VSKPRLFRALPALAAALFLVACAPGRAPTQFEKSAKTFTPR
jgi:hypothetical protein